MAVIENNVLMRVKDSEGNANLFYPVTKADNVEGLSDALATKADTAHTHAVADVDGLQTALDGKADTSHGTHVTFSDDNPKVAGTASVGTATTVARSDHVHPAQTNIAGNARSANKWALFRSIDGRVINGESDISTYAVCSTEGSAAVKEASFSTQYVNAFQSGAEFTIYFTNTNTASNPSLKLKAGPNIYTAPMSYRGSPLPSGYPEANKAYTFRADIEHKVFVIVGDIGLPAHGYALGLVKTGGDCTIVNGVVTVNDNSHEHIVENIRGLAPTLTNYKNLINGKADTSHGTHVTFSDDNPKGAGTASAGTATTVARSDHVHPAQTDITGNAGSATRWARAIFIDGMIVDGTSNVSSYAVCSTEGAVQNKQVTVSLAQFGPLVQGGALTVKFSNTNTVADPKLTFCISGGTVITTKSIHYRGTTLPAGYPEAGSVYTFRYNSGTGAYDIVGDIGLPSTGDTLGLVKSGGDCTITDGVITVNDDSHNHIIQNVDGLQSALNAKASTSDLNTAIDGLRQELLGDTPVEAYNTFTELAAYIEAHQDAADALTSAIGSKADKATTLSGYGITDTYTKAEVDAKISEAIAAALATL